jgi:hypothetical protein
VNAFQPAHPSTLILSPAKDAQDELLENSACELILSEVEG